jgi:uncharacterized protein YbaR (Trm112 family)
VHILLTDILSCPRCGPAFGLILLADRIERRRVLDGALGCANCRNRYPVRNGHAVLQVTAAGEPAEAAAATAAETPAAAGSGGDGRDGEAAERWLALLGVTEGPANVLVAGPGAAVAPAMAALIEHLEVVAADGAATPAGGVTTMTIGGRIPFHDRSLRGVVLTGPAAAALLEEGARCTGPLGRLVVEPAPADAAERLAGAGLRVLAQQGGTVVAARA